VVFLALLGKKGEAACTWLVPLPAAAASDAV
jgi:hypothetical protein